MKRRPVLFLLGAPALAAAAIGQQQPVQLQLRIVPQSGGYGAAAPLTLAGPVNGPVTLGVTSATRSMRFRLDYRVIDLVPNDAIHPAGLVSADFGVFGSASGVTTDTVLARGLLSTRERNSGAVPPAGVAQTDDDPSPADVDGRAGLAGPFRQGWANQNDNNNILNGPVSGLSIPVFTPFNLSQVNQGLAGYDDGSGNPAFPLTGLEWYPLYVFTLTAGVNSAGAVTFDAHALPDPGTHNAFAFWRDGSSIPVTSMSALGASITVNIPAVPGPGGLGVAAAGALAAARRRR